MCTLLITALSDGLENQTGGIILSYDLCCRFALLVYRTLWFQHKLFILEV